MTHDAIADIIGDYKAFFALQKRRLAAKGIDIAGYGLSHLAFRVPDHEQYLHVRGLLERHARANLENVWNGRPISKILLRDALELEPGFPVSMIELIPPVHQRVYKMGLEHLGVVVGEEVDRFSQRHRLVLTGQQFQSPVNEPYYILFEDFTHVKFYRLSLQAVCEREGNGFDHFVHVEGWEPPVLRTATKGEMPAFARARS